MNPRLLATALAIVATLVVPVGNAQELAGERAGTFKSADGGIRLIRAGQSIIPEPGWALAVNDRVVTGHDGHAALTLRDGTTIYIGPRAQLELSAFQFDSTTQLGQARMHLLRGSLRVITGVLGKTSPDRFKVTTPTSVVGVRGTDFIVESLARQRYSQRKGSRSPRSTIP